MRLRPARFHTESCIQDSTPKTNPDRIAARVDLSVGSENQLYSPALVSIPISSSSQFTSAHFSVMNMA